ncbi:MAG: hypothetical protein MUC50_22880 [Myxococcota bacterium]|jgi:hypothetical protein|nr:hypothetical protein [Myxococcota bacterium]
MNCRSLLPWVFFSLVLGIPMPALAGQAGEGVAQAATSSDSPPWWNPKRAGNLSALLLICGALAYTASRAKRGKVPYIRPIAGLDSLADAVGRAAEKGRSVLYCPGLHSIGNPATMASMSLLGSIAERCARLRTRIEVPNYDPMTWPVAQEVVREAYERSGRPEEFRPQDVPYVSSRFLAYASAVAGTMTRERTATNFFIGHFYSEALILAETGAATGALQIAATDSEAQLPFFITTCDHTLIGEELFAAAATVSGDPTARSTIAAHDIVKLVGIGFIVAGMALSLLALCGLEGASELRERLTALLVEAR